MRVVCELLSLAIRVIHIVLSSFYKLVPGPGKKAQVHFEQILMALIKENCSKRGV